MGSGEEFKYTVQVIDKDVRVHEKRCPALDHLLILSHIPQEGLRGSAISVTLFVHLCEASNRLVLPLPVAKLLGGGGLGKVMLNDRLWNSVLSTDANSWNLPLANKASDGFG